MSEENPRIGSTLERQTGPLTRVLNQALAFMIPSVVESEVAGALRDFFATGFGPSSPALASEVDDFLSDPENLVKRPQDPPHEVESIR